MRVCFASGKLQTLQTFLWNPCNDWIPDEKIFLKQPEIRLRGASPLAHRATLRPELGLELHEAPAFRAPFLIGQEELAFSADT
jgi:hypothetical protein